MRFLFILLILLVTSALAQDYENIYLYPGGSDSLTTRQPTILPSRGDNATRLTNITNPILIVVEPETQHKAGVGVIVCPGGGYKHLSIDKEGYEITRWLNGLGITAFILQYRVPDKQDEAYSDIKRAVEIVRERAHEWGIKPGKLGVIGFSAGGNLCAKVGCPDSEEVFNPPDFAMLIYPGGLNKGTDGSLSPYLVISESTPQMFIFGTADDKVTNLGSPVFVGELIKAGIPVELHILPHGGHGYGLRKGNDAAESWPVLAEEWLVSRGLLE